MNFGAISCKNSKFPPLEKSEAVPSRWTQAAQLPTESAAHALGGTPKREGAVLSLGTQCSLGLQPACSGPRSDAHGPTPCAASPILGLT